MTVVAPAQERRAPPAGMHPAAVVSDVWKSFGAVPVLKGVDMTLWPGRVHALLGGNGAGKSTLMRALAGLITPDAGTVEICGERLTQASPAQAQALGLYLVPQEAHILPNQTVLENVCLGLRGQPRALRGQVAALVEQLGIRLDLDAMAASLEIADRQVVEILRGLVRKARILILDEPTSALTPREVASLFARMRALRDQGVALVFISHKLREIREISDTITVLRDGAVVLEGSLAEVSDPALIDAMSRVGSAPSATTAAARPERRTLGPVALTVEALSGEGFRDMSFSVRAGEILGLAGVVGAGRTELAETLFGLRPASAGRVTLRGAVLGGEAPQARVDAGLVYLPEDRQRNGLFLEAPLHWNVSSYLTHHLSIFPSSSRGHRLFETFRDRMNIRCTGPNQAARYLSGGNQQKVLLAKCLAAKPAVLILDEPTRGVDVAARTDIYALVEELAAEGLAVLLISSDFEEIVRLADRVVVMTHGMQTGTVEGAIEEAAIARLAFGAEGVAVG